MYNKSSKADIRNPLLLLAHERSRFANCQRELLTPTDIIIPLTHQLVLYTLEAGDCLFCVQSSSNIMFRCPNHNREFQQNFLSYKKPDVAYTTSGHYSSYSLSINKEILIKAEDLQQLMPYLHHFPHT